MSILDIGPRVNAKNKACLIINISVLWCLLPIISKLVFFLSHTSQSPSCPVENLGFEITLAFYQIGFKLLAITLNAVHIFASAVSLVSCFFCVKYYLFLG